MNEFPESSRIFSRHLSRQRLYEILPGALTWGTLALPVVFSYLAPNAVAVFFVLYTTFWFVRSMEFAVAIPYAYWRTRRQMGRDWSKILDLFEHEATNRQGALFTDVSSGVEDGVRVAMKEAIAFHRQNGTLKLPLDIVHLIVIATYRESYDVLQTTFERILSSNFSAQHMIVILAGEERDRENFESVSSRCAKTFGAKFKAFYSTAHPDGTPGEVRGKGSNITYACREVVPKILSEHESDPSNIIVTTLDADNCVDRQYFSILTYHYVVERDRKRRSYQPLALFYNNLWEVPFVTRISVLGSGFWNLIESVRPYRLRNFASHAQSLDALLETDFWSSSTIVEDGHQYWRSYFTFQGKYAVVPLFVPIYQDAAQNRTYWKSLQALYLQVRRWAWGCSDTPYVLDQLRKHKDHIPFMTRVIQRYRLIESYYSWATAAFLLTLTFPIPRLVNAEFAQTATAYHMGIILSWMYTLAWIGILVTVGMSLLTTPAIPHSKHPAMRMWIRLSLLLQWIVSPVITILFGAIPAVEAQTRLMLGKYLDFNVTEKVRTARPPEKV